MDATIIIGLIACLLAVPGSILSYRKLYPKVRDNGIDILWTDESNYNYYLAGQRYFKRPFQNVETIQISKADRPATIKKLHDRYILELGIKAETADYIDPTLEIRLHIQLDDTLSEISFFRIIETLSIITREVTRNHISTVSIANFREARLELQETLLEQLKQRTQTFAITLDSLYILPNISYPIEVVQAMKEEKDIVLKQRPKLANENFKNMLHMKQIDTEIINRKKLATVDAATLEKVRTLLDDDSKLAARYILLMRYAHETGRAITHTQEEHTPEDVLSMLGQLEDHIDPAPGPNGPNN